MAKNNKSRAKVEEVEDVVEEIETADVEDVENEEIEEIESEEVEEEESDEPKLISLKVAKTIIHNGRVYVANEKIELEREHAKALVKKGYLHSPKK